MLAPGPRAQSHPLAAASAPSPPAPGRCSVCEHPRAGSCQFNQPPGGTWPNGDTLQVTELTAAWPRRIRPSPDG